MTMLSSPPSPSSRRRSSPVPLPSAQGRPAPATHASVPISSSAWSALQAESQRGFESVRGGADPELWRRLQSISEVLDHAVVADDRGLAAVGRRITFRETDGARMTLALVIPGDGDPRQGWVAIDSPLGRALLGARVGDEVTVRAPAGDRTVRIEAIA